MSQPADAQLNATRRQFKYQSVCQICTELLSIHGVIELTGAEWLEKLNLAARALPDVPERFRPPLNRFDELLAWTFTLLDIQAGAGRCWTPHDGTNPELDYALGGHLLGEAKQHQRMSFLRDYLLAGETVQTSIVQDNVVEDVEISGKLPFVGDEEYAIVAKSMEATSAGRMTRTLRLTFSTFDLMIDYIENEWPQSEWDTLLKLLDDALIEAEQ